MTNLETIERLRAELADVLRATCNGRVMNRASLALRARDLDRRIRDLEAEEASA